jgi:hypothetical protein
MSGWRPTAPCEHRPGDRIVGQFDRIPLPAAPDQYLEHVAAVPEASNHAFEAAPVGAQRRLDRSAVQEELDLLLQAGRNSHLDPRVASGNILRRAREHAQLDFFPLIVRPGETDSSKGNDCNSRRERQPR